MVGCDMFQDAGIECGSSEDGNSEALAGAMEAAEDMMEFACDLLKCGSYCAANELDCSANWKEMCEPTAARMEDCDVDCSKAPPPKFSRTSLGLSLAMVPAVSILAYLH